jgi:diacylglycerol kinase (ATP)
MRRVRLIVNTQAGTKAGPTTNRTSVDDVLDAVGRRALTDDVHLTSSEHQAVDLTREAVRTGYDVVAGAGGDGTLGVIAGELLHTETALGVIPFGSVMNIPRMLGIPRDLHAALDLLCTGESRPIDVGLANGKIFYEVGSVGMNAAMFEQFERLDDGDFRALLSGIWVALRYRPARMRITLDKGEFTSRALMVSVANGPYTGIGFTVAPNAVLGDGLFDVRVFRRFSRAELAFHLGAIAFGRRRYSPLVDTFHSQRVTIQAVSDLPARADSNSLGTTPITFECLPRALYVIAP